MIPVGGIIGAIYVARWLVNRGKPGSSSRPPDYRGLNRPVTAALIVRCVLPFVATAFVLSWAADGLATALRSFGWMGWLLLLLFPFTAAVLLPLGAVKVAHWMSIHPFPMTSPVYRADRPQYAAMIAALALLRRKAHEPGLEAWIGGRLDAAIAGKGMRAPGLACIAFLAASRGDETTAREMLLGVLEQPWAAVPPPVRRLVQRWLIASAAQHGTWELFLLRRIAWKRGGLLRFGRAVAWSRSEKRSRWRLLWTWLLCGPRLRLWGVLRMAWGAPDQGSAPERSPLPGANPLEQALAAHAAMEQGTGPLVVLRAVSAWRAALDGDTGAEVSPELRVEVLDVLAASMDRVGLSVRGRPDGSVVGELYQRQRERVWAGLSDEVAGMNDRVTEGKLLPAVDEWRAWFSVRRCMDALDEADAAAAMGDVGGPLTNIAAALYNRYSERALAHAMFRWLALHADRYGFSELHRINEKNTRVAA